MKGILFDLDGVLTPTVTVHMRAWERLFTAYFSEHGLAPYTESDYFEHLDGKPRYDGVRDLLLSRGVDLPWGSPDDSPERDTVCGLGNKKNVEFAQALADDGVEPYPGSTLFLEASERANLAVAVVSSSKNADAVLRAAGIREHFAVVVDGVVAAAHGITGKPAPDTYEYGASELGLDIGVCVVVEDAVSGVAAGRAGNFGKVIGVNRGVGAQVLLDNGADIVVDDLAELVVEES